MTIPASPSPTTTADALTERPLPPIAKALSPEAIERFRTGKALSAENNFNKGKFAIKKPLPPDHPEVAAGVLDLESLMAPSLTPEEVAFQEEQNRKPAKPHFSAPKTFLNAHMVIIEQLLIDPGVTQTRLATLTGYSLNWLHKVMSSDAFQAKLAEEQKRYLDPIILTAVKDRLGGLISRSLEVMETKMDSPNITLDQAMGVFEMAAKATGMGAQKAVAPTQQFIVHMPQPQQNADSWAAQYNGGRTEKVIDSGGTETVVATLTPGTADATIPTPSTDMEYFR